MSGTVHLSRRGAHVAILEIDNPPANALSHDVIAAFATHLDAIEAEEALRAVVLTGRGSRFCAGADLKEVRQGIDGAPSNSSGGVLPLLNRVEALRMPVIAAIRGPCVGGGLELALRCDLRVATADARFGCPGVNLGGVYSAYRLPRLIGVARAKQMLLTGSLVDAMTALSFGLIMAISPADELLEQAFGLADRIATRAPLAVEAAKRVIDVALDLDPEEGFKFEQKEQDLLRNSEDRKEAVDAFLNKREPVFRRT